MNLREVHVRPIERSEEGRYQELMDEHHYLGRLPKISETLWYIAVFRDQWVALLSFSAAALKCSARDQWIGWSSRHQYDRLKLIANNSRFLILPDWHVPNLGSRVLSTSQKRLLSDWRSTFGHPLVLLETFVDPQRFHGTVYRAANWLCVGETRGFRRTGKGYSAKIHSPKMVFVKPLQRNARALLSGPFLESTFGTGGTKIMITAEQMQSLPQFFADIPDPRRIQGRRHRLSTVLAIAAGAVLCGMRGYKAIADWAKSLGQKARERFRCRVENGRCVVPSESIIRDILIRIDPSHLDNALQKWNEAYGAKDESLAIDGKTMCNSIDEQGYRTHIMSAIGHQTKSCYTQKK
ncbi:MAG: Druantia anti-phage system protein DruA [Syntrophobacteraceae bacterium]